ncbi:MAG: hypothetical protein R3F34_05465 [Planctomycetota bacterium]
MSVAPERDAIEVGDDVPAKVLDRGVRGRGLGGTTLREVLGDRATALVFLRHYG